MKTRILLLITAALAALTPLTAAQALPGPPYGPPAVAAPKEQPAAAPNEQPAAATRASVTGGALFGGTPSLATVHRLHRRLAITRVYFTLGQRFTRYDYRQDLASGSTLLVSLDARPGHGPGYAAIARGARDRQIRAFLEGVNHAAVAHHLPAIYISFEHEANLPGHRELGSPAAFVRAWDHIHRLAARARLNWQQGGRLHWVLILMSQAYVPRARQPGWARNEGQAAWYWPGRREADLAGVDGYNAGGCRSAHGRPYRAPGRQVVTPAAMFGPAVQFARAHHAPLFIAEWGTVPYRTRGVAPGYIHQMQRFVTSSPEIAGALYWDQDGTSGVCDYRLERHPAEMRALAAMGHSLGLQGHLARR